MPRQIIFATFCDLAFANLAKMLARGTLELFMTAWNTLFSKNAYMWDLTEFYDDLEHYFKIVYTCWTKVGS
jgi:hypothetical protein